MRSPIFVSTSVCLKPPPAATISRMPAIGGSDCSERLAPIALASMPAPRPRVNTATITAMSSAIKGVPRKSSTTRTGAFLSAMKMSASALRQHEHDRQQHGGEGDRERSAGRRCSVAAAPPPEPSACLALVGGLAAR